MTISQRTPLAGKGERDVAGKGLAHDVLEHGPAEAGPLWRADLGPAGLLPDELQLLGLLAEIPLDADLAVMFGQRAVFLRIGGQLVQREPEIVHGLGLQHDVLALDGDAFAEAFRMGLQLLLHQHAQ